MTWGAEAYVVKSSNFSELKRKIREVLGRREKVKEGSGSKTKAPSDISRNSGPKNGK
jgi:DNA-binding response OmpR family regulator